MLNVPRLSVSTALINALILGQVCSAIAPNRFDRLPIPKSPLTIANEQKSTGRSKQSNITEK